MKKLFGLIIILVLAVGASAQTILTTPVAPATQNRSIYLDASITHDGSFPNTVPGGLGFLKSDTNIGGIDAGVSHKLKGMFGWSTDMNFSHNNAQNQFLALCGPEISPSFGKSNWFQNNRLFVHTQLGASFQAQKVQGFNNLSQTDWSMAFAAGGGMEHFFGQHMGMRTGLDYIFTNAFHGSENNLRASAGFVVRF